MTDDPTIRTEVENGVADCELIDRLIEIRGDRGMTQKKVAEILGCDPSKISRMEAGDDNQLNWGDIKDYTRAIGVRMSILFDVPSEPAAHRIKHLIMAMCEPLNDLATIARSAGDEEIAGSIHKFFGEVFLNFMSRFSSSLNKFSPFLRVDKQEDVVDGEGHTHSKQPQSCIGESAGKAVRAGV